MDELQGLPVGLDAREKQVAGEFKQQCALPFAKNAQLTSGLRLETSRRGYARQNLISRDLKTIGSVLRRRVIATALLRSKRHPDVVIAGALSLRQLKYLQLLR